MKLLLDSCVWLAWAKPFNEPDHEAALELLTRCGRGEVELRLLDLTVYELGNVATRSWKKSPKDADLLVRAALDITATPPLVPTLGERSKAHALAEQHSLSVYDATYAAVARERRLKLVSGDRALLRAELAVAPAAV